MTENWDQAPHSKDVGEELNWVHRRPPQSGHPQLSSLSGTMRISDMVERAKIPPASGWRKSVYRLSLSRINFGESPAERRYRQLSERIRRHIRRKYVIGVVSGKGGVGTTTMTTCIGSVFRECRPDNVVAVDAVPGFGTLASRIEHNSHSGYRRLLTDTDIQGYTDIRQYLGQNDLGLDVLAGDILHDQPPVLLPSMFTAAFARLRRSHTVLVVDTGDDLAHPVSRSVLDFCDTLLFVSGLTPDTSLPVSRTIDILRAMGYHDLVSRSTLILNNRGRAYDSGARQYLTRGYEESGLTVEFMPYDRHLARGGIVDTRYGLHKKTRLRLFEISAAIADKYSVDADLSKQFPEQH